MPLRYDWIEQRDINQCANDLILAADGDLSRELALRFARHAAESFGLRVRKPEMMSGGRI